MNIQSVTTPTEVIDSLLQHLSVNDLFKLKDKVDMQLREVKFQLDQKIGNQLSEMELYIKATFPGRKLEAVKYVKEKTGLGLKESKDYVDKLM